jgi:hypothetical protein
MKTSQKYPIVRYQAEILQVRTFPRSAWDLDLHMRRLESELQ